MSDHVTRLSGPVHNVVTNTETTDVHLPGLVVELDHDTARQLMVGLIHSGMWAHEARDALMARGLHVHEVYARGGAS